MCFFVLQHKLPARRLIHSLLYTICVLLVSHAELHNNNIKGSLCLHVHFGAVVQTLLDWPGCRLAAWGSENQRLGNEGDCDTRSYYSTDLFPCCNAFVLDNP